MPDLFERHFIGRIEISSQKVLINLSLSKGEENLLHKVFIYILCD